MLVPLPCCLFVLFVPFSCFSNAFNVYSLLMYSIACTFRSLYGLFF